MAQIKDLKRMCVTYMDNGCDGCPLGYRTNYCIYFPCNMSDNADEIVDKWTEEHPVKTYAMDFFEKFPNAIKSSNGQPWYCRANIYGDKPECHMGSCEECWNKEIKENG